MDPTREDLPRVAVDTVHDWQRIKTTIANTALAKLEARMVASGSAPNRGALLQHMNQFVGQTFTMAEPNLRVNGRNLEEIDENEQEMEAFDETLDRNIWSLSDKRLKWDLEIATKRRNKPEEVEASLDDLFQKQRSAETAEMDAVSDGDGAEQDETDQLEERYPRIQEVASNISSTTEELGQSVPIQRERSNRIKTVTKEVKNLKP